MNSEITKRSPQEFFDALIEMRGISKLSLYLAKLITEMDKDISDNVLKFLYLYLSLQEDGNTCFAMDVETFEKKWETKWNSLVQLKKSEYPNITLATIDDFHEIIIEGIQYILHNKDNAIIENRQENVPSSKNTQSKLFVLNNGNLYATKFFDAKCIIEDTAKNIFKNGINPKQEDIDKCIEDHKKVIQNYILKQKQAEAIVRGLQSNLIITGGPGTGKTTVVLFILWNLLKSDPEKYLDWNIYLAAPSGKAADRMRESLSKGLKDINPSIAEKNSEIFDKLSNLESSTIHRLLRYSTRQSGFAINAKNKFDEKSIFVIDEASMIDINLFASFMQAIPENNARVFILGDAFQLPSVDAGAVLGEILTSKRAKENFVVELNESNRFNDESAIGRLAISIKQCALNSKAKLPETDFYNYTEQKKLQNNEVNFIKIVTEKKDQELEVITDLVKEWNSFFFDFPNMAAKVHPTDKLPDDHEKQARKAIWDKSLKMRMLSAERKGNRGVITLNNLACEAIKEHVKNYNKENPSSKIHMPINKYFPGELLILTENQSMYKLYNGDSGIVIFDEFTPYLMLKKAPPSKLNSSESVGNDYEFYPLSLLPEEALEPAFAITIHKSQGSEYENVLMFLPSQAGHPLLTNQILYTGITRSKKSVTTVATSETFASACKTISKRETGIEL